MALEKKYPAHPDLTGGEETALHFHPGAAHKTFHQDGGADEISIAGLDGSPAQKAAASGIASLNASSLVVQKPADRLSKANFEITLNKLLKGAGAGADPTEIFPPVRGATLVIAANNSSARSKEQADYICDGTDDQDEINTALAALTLGGTVLLLEGTYNLTAEIGINEEGAKTFNDGTTLMGQGFGTRLKLMANWATVALIVVHGYPTLPKGIKICNLQLDGNRAAYTSTRGLLIAAHEFIVESLWVHDFYHQGIAALPAVGSMGIVRDCFVSNIIGSTDAHLAGIYCLAIRSTLIVEDNFIYNIGTGTTWGFGIFLEAATAANASTALIVKNNYIEETSWAGIVVDRNRNILIEGNVIRNCCNSGAGYNAQIFVCGDSTYQCANVKIINNYIYQNKTIPYTCSGIFVVSDDVLTNCQYISIIGNTIRNMKCNGIIIQGCQDILIADNEIYDCDVLNSVSYNGITLGTPAFQPNVVNVKNNVVRENDKYEILVYANSTNIVIEHNDVNGSDHLGAISDSGTATRIKGNVGYNSAADEITKSVLTEQGDIIYASGVATPAALAHGTSGQVLLSGGHGANPSWASPSFLTSVVRKTADETVNNSAALQSDDHLILPIGANESWLIQLFLIFESHANADFKFGWSCPDGCSMVWGTLATRWVSVVATASPSTLQTIEGTDGSGTGGVGAIQGLHTLGVLLNGATAGNLTLTWAQLAAHASNTKVRANSCLIAHKLV